MTSNDDPEPQSRRKLHFQSFDRPELWTGDYVEFAAAVGYVTWAWNALHADLCDLFWQITGIDAPDIPRAIWYSTRSDAGQRQMLIGAAKVRLEGKPLLLEEVLWLTAEIDRLASLRNDSVHTLWTTELDLDLENRFELRRARPDPVRGAPKAARLEGTDYKQAFEDMAGYLMTLIQFSRAISLEVRGWNDEPLPERPLRPQSLVRR